MHTEPPPSYDDAIASVPTALKLHFNTGNSSSDPHPPSSSTYRTSSFPMLPAAHVPDHAIDRTAHHQAPEAPLNVINSRQRRRRQIIVVCAAIAVLAGVVIAVSIAITSSSSSSSNHTCTVSVDSTKGGTAAHFTACTSVINADISFTSSPVITSLVAPALTLCVGGSLIVSHCGVLWIISLPQLTYCGWYIKINSNVILTYVGLPVLTYLGDALDIRYNIDLAFLQAPILTTVICSDGCVAGQLAVAYCQNSAALSFSPQLPYTAPGHTCDISSWSCNTQSTCPYCATALRINSNSVGCCSCTIAFLKTC